MLMDFGHDVLDQVEERGKKLVYWILTFAKTPIIIEKNPRKTKKKLCSETIFVPLCFLFLKFSTNVFFFKKLNGTFIKPPQFFSIPQSE